MKSILCYVLSILISIFECVDTIYASFKEIPKDADYFIDPMRATSALEFTFSTQLAILGVATIFIILGIVASNAEDNKIRWE